MNIFYIITRHTISMSEPIIYYKVTNKDENHHSFQYQDGLNILIQPFNKNVYDSCCKGGFYFTTLDNIHKFLEFGEYIREVSFPTNNPSFKMIQCISGDTYRSNMAILGKKYNMFDIKTILYFKLHMAYDFIDSASKNGHIDVLEWFKNSGYKFKYSVNAIKLASQNCHVNVLKWFKNSGYEFKYSADAIDLASENGHVNVLEWFKNSGYEFKYSENTIDWLSYNRHVNILE